MNATQLDRAFQLTFLSGALCAVGSGLLRLLGQSVGPFWPSITLDLYLAGLITLISMCSFVKGLRFLGYLLQLVAVLSALAFLIYLYGLFTGEIRFTGTAPLHISEAEKQRMLQFSYWSDVTLFAATFLMAFSLVFVLAKKAREQRVDR